MARTVLFQPSVRAFFVFFMKNTIHLILQNTINEAFSPITRAAVTAIIHESLKGNHFRERKANTSVHKIVYFLWNNHEIKTMMVAKKRSNGSVKSQLWKIEFFAKESRPDTLQTRLLPSSFIIHLLFIMQAVGLIVGFWGPTREVNQVSNSAHESSLPS